MVTAGSESKALVSLREERDNFESLFQAKAEECAELAQTNAALKTQVLLLTPGHCLSKSPFPLSLQLGQLRKRGGSTSYDEEKTLAPGTTLLRPSTPTEDRSLRASLSPEDMKVFEGLREQLKLFCNMADHLKLAWRDWW